MKELRPAVATFGSLAPLPLLSESEFCMSSTKGHFFVRFFGEVRKTQIAFKIIWPLTAHSFHVGKNLSKSPNAYISNNIWFISLQPCLLSRSKCYVCLSVILWLPMWKKISANCQKQTFPVISLKLISLVKRTKFSKTMAEFFRQLIYGKRFIKR